jgi:hypothetical protein
VVSAVSWRPLYLLGTGLERPVGLVWDAASNVVVLHKDKVQVKIEAQITTVAVLQSYNNLRN